MPVCTFFGHRDTSDTVATELATLLRELIVSMNVNVFYIGNHGNFDRIALNVVKKLQKEFSHIKYYVVFAYLPAKIDNNEENSLYPDGLEFVPKRFAVSFRNKWMVDNSDFVLTCVSRNFGGAAKFKEYAKRKNKKVIELNQLARRGNL